MADQFAPYGGRLTEEEAARLQQEQLAAQGLYSPSRGVERRPPERTISSSPQPIPDYPRVSTRSAGAYTSITNPTRTNDYYNRYVAPYYQSNNQPPVTPPPATQPPSTVPPSAPPPASTPTNPGDPNSGYGTAGPSVDGGISTAEPLQMAEQDRIRAASIGDALEADTQAAQGRYQNREGSFLERGDLAYRDILEGRSGFTPEEARNLTQEGLLRAGIASPEQINSLGLSASEQANIRGTPYLARDMTVPYLTKMDQQQASAAGNLRSAVDRMRLDLDRSVDPSLLRADPNLGTAARGNVENLASSYRDVLDPRFLTLSGEFTRDYNITPRDIQNIKDAAASGVMKETQAQNDALTRAAASAGNTNPLALAAARARAQRYGQLGGADAALDAEMAARNLALGTTMGRENMRLGAETAFADRNVAGLNKLADMAQSNIYGVEDRRRAAEQDIADRYRDLATTVGAARIGTEGDIGQTAQEATRFQAGTVGGMTERAESEDSRRLQDIAGNRQESGWRGIDTRFGQALPASTALSDRYGNVYGQKKAEEQEGRGWLTGQQGAAQQGAQTTRQQRIDAYGTQIGGLNQATGNAIPAKYIPGWFEKAGGIVGGLFG